MRKHRSYPVEFKRQVAQEYLAGETLHGLAKRHEILARDFARLSVEAGQHILSVPTRRWAAAHQRAAGMGHGSLLRKCPRRAEEPENCQHRVVGCGLGEERFEPTAQVTEIATFHAYRAEGSISNQLNLLKNIRGVVAGARFGRDRHIVSAAI